MTPKGKLTQNCDFCAKPITEELYGIDNLFWCDACSTVVDKRIEPKRIKTECHRCDVFGDHEDVVGLWPMCDNCIMEKEVEDMGDYFTDDKMHQRSIHANKEDPQTGFRCRVCPSPREWEKKKPEKSKKR